MKSINKGRLFAFAQFLLLSLMFIALYFRRLQTSSNILRFPGFALVVSGLIIGSWAVISYRQKITVNPYPLEDVKLRTGGIYGKIRHPMYFSVFLFVSGWCIYFFSLYSMLFVLITLAFLIMKIRFEEKQLIEKFPQYQEYKNRTYTLIPFVY